MSPEQLQGKLVDTRSDIFSFGTVLYELVTGERPFKGDNAATLIAAVLTTEPRALTEVQPKLPATLDRVLKACLAKDPEDRWQSVRDLKRELEWIGAAADVPAVAPRTSVISKRLLFPVLAAVCIAAGASLWYLLRPNIPAIPPWKVSPLTAYAGIEQMPAISPAGDQVAFVWDGERQDNEDIYLKRIDDEGPPLRLTSTHQSEYAPCWSPDGQRLAFLREQADGTELIVASSLGGGERVYGTFKGMLPRIIPSTLSWSGDGRHIAIARCRALSGGRRNSGGKYVDSDTSARALRFNAFLRA